MSEMTPAEVREYMDERFADLLQPVPKYTAPPPAPKMVDKFVFDPDLDELTDPVLAVKFAIDQLAQRRKAATDALIEDLRNQFYGLHVLLNDLGEDVERSREHIRDIRTILTDIRERQ